MQKLKIEFLGAEMEVGYTWPLGSDLDELEIETATIGGIDVTPMLDTLAYRAAMWAGAGDRAFRASNAVFDALAEEVAAEVVRNGLDEVPDEIRTRAGVKVSTLVAA